MSPPLGELPFILKANAQEILLLQWLAVLDGAMPAAEAGL